MMGNCPFLWIYSEALIGGSRWSQFCMDETGSLKMKKFILVTGLCFFSLKSIYAEELNDSEILNILSTSSEIYIAKASARRITHAYECRGIVPADGLDEAVYSIDCSSDKVSGVIYVKLARSAAPQTRLSEISFEYSSLP